MVPLSVLGQLRKHLVNQLDKTLLERPIRRNLHHEYLDRWRSLSSSGPTEAKLSFLARTKEQLEFLQTLHVDRVYCDFQDIREYREAVAIGHDADFELYLATPRIQKPGELGIFKSLEKNCPDGILVRNLSGIEYFKDKFPLVADFSLNATNQITVEAIRSMGVELVTPSYDLNRDQLEMLVKHCDPRHLQIVVHQHMPMFHMEHCVFCSVLSPGTDKTNCGRPCDFHQVELRDRTGSLHPLHADVGCRNTLFNSQPQSAAEMVPDLIKLGVSDFRVELLRETTFAQIENLFQQYQGLIQGSLTGTQVWKSLNAMNRVGITRGTLEHDRDPLAIL